MGVNNLLIAWQVLSFFCRPCNPYNLMQIVVVGIFFSRFAENLGGKLTRFTDTKRFSIKMQHLT